MMNEHLEYRGFTITTKPYTPTRDGRPRYTWQITWQEYGIPSIPVNGTSGYHSEKMAIGFAKDYINERLAAAGESVEVDRCACDDLRERIAELEAQLADLQVDYIKEAEIANNALDETLRLKAQLAAQQMPDEVKVAIVKLTDYGMPLGATHADWTKWRDTTITWLTASGGE